MTPPRTDKHNGEIVRGREEEGAQALSEIDDEAFIEKQEGVAFMECVAVHGRGGPRLLLLLFMLFTLIKYSI